MRLHLFVLGFITFVASAARGDDDCRCWASRAEDIAKLEAKIAGRLLPLGNLDQYARHYARVTENGRQIIVGRLIPGGWLTGKTAGIYIESDAELKGEIPWMSHGCISSIIDVRYDLSSNEIWSGPLCFGVRAPGSDHGSGRS